MNWRKVADPNAAAAALGAGKITSESVSGYSYSLTGALVTQGFTGDPEIDQIMALYRRRFIGSSATMG